MLHYSDFVRLVRERILLCGMRETICGDCQWDAFCRLPQKDKGGAYDL